MRDLLVSEERNDLASLRDQLDLVLARIGDNGIFSATLEPVLVDTLARVQATHSRELSRTLAPLVVSTIRSELRNSREEMVNALYPLTGKMVSAALRAAMARLSEQINTRIEAASNPQMMWARLKAKLTGKAVSTYVLARAEPAHIMRAILIEKNSGTLVALWARGGDETGDADMVSGLIEPLSSFASQTYANRQSDLRTIELAGDNLHLRHAPAYLLALDVEGRSHQNTA